MHPFVKDRQRLVLYLAVWVVVGLALAAFLWRIHGTPMPTALLVMEPLALLYGVVCL